MTAAKRRQYGTGSIYQRADGVWIGAVMAGWTAGGKRRRITVSGKTQAIVRAKLKKIDIDDGPAGVSVRTTVKAWADQWLAVQARRLRPKTAATNASAIKNWVVPTIGSRKLADLNPGDLRKVADAIRAAGLSTTTAHRTHVVLKKMLKDAIAEGHGVPQRVLVVGAPAKAVHDRAAVPVPDAVRLLVETADWPDRSRWGAALLQGMRQGECLGLTWDCVDLDVGTIDVSWQLQRLPYISGRKGALRVPDGYEHRPIDGSLCLVRPKTTHGSRIIPIVGWMATALEEWRRVAPHSPAGLVWPTTDGRPRSPESDRDEWQALQCGAGIGHPSGRYYLIHEARHTAATLLMALGVDETVRIAIMGHSSIAVTQAYQHADIAQARTALEAAAGRLGLTA